MRAYESHSPGSNPGLGSWGRCHTWSFSLCFSDVRWESMAAPLEICSRTYRFKAGPSTTLGPSGCLSHCPPILALEDP